MNILISRLYLYGNMKSEAARKYVVRLVVLTQGIEDPICDRFGVLLPILWIGIRTFLYLKFYACSPIAVYHVSLL